MTVKRSNFSCPQCGHVIKLKKRVVLLNDFHLYCPKCKCGMTWYDGKWTCVKSKTDIIRKIYKT